MNNKLFAGKSTRTKIFTVITLLSILLLLALNLLMSYFGIFGNAYLDLTPEGLYTLRPVMVDACRDIFLEEDGTPKEQGIKITFCNDPDYLIENTITRVVYYMALALSKEYPNFQVETVNIKYNPTAVAMYKTTSLTEITPSDVIISHGSRYRIASAKSFWNILSDNTVYSFDGEFKLASIMLSLTLINKPTAYFVSDHGEDIYDPDAPESESSRRMGYFADLLTEKGFGIKKLSLSELISKAEAEGVTPAIPEDCMLLIVNNPKEDFRADPTRFDSLGYVSETELLDRYLTAGKGSIMVAKDYRCELSNLEDFLSEWGIEYSNTLVKDEGSCLIKNNEPSLTDIVGIYDKSEDNYTYGIYGEYASLTSAPRMIVTDTGHIRCAFGDGTAMSESGTFTTSKTFVPFLYSSDKAHEYDKNGVDRASQNPDTKNLAALTARKYLDPDTGNGTYSYIFAAASADFFAGELLGNASYANYDVISSLVQEICLTDTYADDSLGGVSVNNYTDFGGKPIVELKMDTESRVVYKYREDGKTEAVRTVYGLGNAMKVVYTVIICLIPLSCAVVGVIICAKRKYL